MTEQPLMEHPTGEYENAIEAMTAALQRLRSLPEWNRWITFCAQGEGDSPESTRFAEVRILADIVDAGVAVDIAQLANQANVEPLQKRVEIVIPSLRPHLARRRSCSMLFFDTFWEFVHFQMKMTTMQ